MLFSVCFCLTLQQQLTEGKTDRERLIANEHVDRNNRFYVYLHTHTHTYHSVLIHSHVLPCTYMHTHVRAYECDYLCELLSSFVAVVVVLALDGQKLIWLSHLHSVVVTFLTSISYCFLLTTKGRTPFPQQPAQTLNAFKFEYPFRFGILDIMFLKLEYM